MSAYEIERLVHALILAPTREGQEAARDALLAAVATLRDAALLALKECQHTSGEEPGMLRARLDGVALLLRGGLDLDAGSARYLDAARRREKP